MNSYFCCCHIETAAATVGILQLVVVALTLSNSATIYYEWPEWQKNLEPSGGLVNMPVAITAPTTGKGYLGIQLANTIAVQGIWTGCLVIYMLAFIYKRALMVLPDLFMQLLSLIWNLHFLGSLGQALNEANCINGIRPLNQQSAISDLQNGQDRCTFIITMLIINSFLFISQTIFLAASFSFFRYLRQVQSTVYPEGAAYLKGHPTV